MSGGFQPGSRAIPAGTYAAATTWQPTTTYAAGQIVANGGIYYAAKVAFTSGSVFNATNWNVAGSTFVQSADIHNIVNGSGADANTLYLGAGTIPPYTQDPARAGSNSSVGSANRAIAQRVKGDGATITKLAVHCSAKATTVHVAVAVLRGAAGIANPDTVVQASGSVLLGGTGYQEIALGGSVAVEPETDWFVLACDDISATTWRCVASVTQTDSQLALGFGAYVAASGLTIPAGGWTAAFIPPVVIVGIP